MIAKLNTRIEHFEKELKAFQTGAAGSLSPQVGDDLHLLHQVQRNILAEKPRLPTRVEGADVGANPSGADVGANPPGIDVGAASPPQIKLDMQAAKIAEIESQKKQTADLLQLLENVIQHEKLFEYLRPLNDQKKEIENEKKKILMQIQKATQTHTADANVIRPFYEELTKLQLKMEYLPNEEETRHRAKVLRQVHELLNKYDPIEILNAPFNYLSLPS